MSANVCFEDEGFWEAAAPLLFAPRYWESAPLEMERAAGLLELPAGAAVLDMPCGPGRHSLELVRRGFRVTGVDRTRAYLRQAAERAISAGLSAEWVESDMREFRRPEAYDGALNLYTSFGYFPDAADDRRVLDHYFASLKPGGRLLMDMMGKEVLARVFERRGWQEASDGTVLLEERTIRSGWGWVDNRWIVIRGERRTEHRFSLRLFSAVELGKLLSDAGFVDLRFHGSLTGVPYDDAAERLIVLATKP